MAGVIVPLLADCAKTLDMNSIESKHLVPESHVIRGAPDGPPSGR